MQKEMKNEFKCFTTKCQPDYKARMRIHIEIKYQNDRSLSVSTITLNVNGLNAPTIRHRLVEWIKKKVPYTCCLLETHFRYKDTNRLKVKRWKKTLYKY